MSWCTKCHYGSEVYKPKLGCTACGHTEITEKNPLPTKPTRSIRAMDKRKEEIEKRKRFERGEKKVDLELEEDIAHITGDHARAKKYGDLRKNKKQENKVTNK